MRQALEQNAARLAAARSTPLTLRRLRAIEAKMNAMAARELATERDYRRWTALNSSFHLSLAKASGNTPLATLLETVLAMIVVGRLEVVKSLGNVGVYLSRMSSARICEEHAALSAALERHDEDQAASLVTEHLASSMALFSTVEKLYHDQQAIRRVQSG